MQFFVGSYGDRGLHSLTLAADGSLAVHGSSDAAANASFGAYSRRRGLLYLVDEGEAGTVGAYRWLDGGWKQAAQVPSHGALPCYLSLNGDETSLAVANYGDGACALIALDPQTGLPTADAVVEHNQGSGPVKDRQDRPHAHCAVFSRDGWLYQTDLGTDEIRAFRVDAGAGTLGESTTAWRAPPGSGPRHLAFHPTEPLAVLVCELASTLTLFEVSEGRLIAKQAMSTLPRGFSGDSLGGHLAFSASGERLFVSNRGHDSIAAFALEEGRLSLLAHTPAAGASPRFFLLLEDPARLLVANEEGDSITAFDLRANGTLSKCGEARVPKPAFIFATPAIAD